MTIIANVSHVSGKPRMEDDTTQVLCHGCRRRGRARTSLRVVDAIAAPLAPRMRGKPAVRPKCHYKKTIAVGRYEETKKGVATERFSNDPCRH